MEMQHYLDDIVNVFTEEIDENLVGVYLHGSLAMGCFNPERSDVDLLVVVKEKLSDELKKALVKRLLELTSEKHNQLEMSIILERYLKDFVYPTPFELHYFRPEYLTDESYICGGDGFTDPDLAGHMMVTYERGKTLYGQEVKKAFQQIEKKYYLASIYNDVKDARQGMIENPVYFTLNLCRVLYFIREEVVSSKREAGEWALMKLPEEFQDSVKQSLDHYNESPGELQPDVDPEKMTHYAEWMLHEIEHLK